MKKNIKKIVAYSYLSILLAGLLIPTSTLAFSFYQGNLKGSFDTDLTYGVSLRTEDADKANLSAYGNRLFNDAGDVLVVLFEVLVHLH